MKIISKHDPKGGLQVALDIESWAIKPMTYNESEGQWEYVVDTGDKEVEKVHFKFIDGNGTWFTDNDFPKEFDDIGNENNVIYSNSNGPELKNYVTNTNDANDSPTNTPKEQNLASLPETKTVNNNDTKKEEKDKNVEAEKAKGENNDKGVKDEPKPTNFENNKPGSTTQNKTGEEHSQPQEVVQEPAAKAETATKKEVSKERPTTAETSVTHRSDPITEYSSFLDRIILFLKRTISKWFSFQGSSSTNS